MLHSADEGITRLYGRPPYVVAGQVGNYLREHAAKNDTLYVAFYEADIYHLAQMRSTSRFLFRLDLDAIDGAFDSVVRDVEAEKPTFVVDLHQPLDARLDTGRFFRALREHYDEVQSIDSAVIYRRAERSHR